MKFASGISTAGEAEQAIVEFLSAVQDQMGGEAADLALLFATPHFEDDFGRFRRELSAALGPVMQIGCTAEGVIGEGREIEQACSVSLLVGRLPGVRLRSFHVDQAGLEQAYEEDALGALVGEVDTDARGTILLADPFSIHIDMLLEALGKVLPGLPVVGGLASGAEEPGQNVLLLDSGRYREGAVGVVLCGDVRISCVVSQGCRPIGLPYVITKADRNVIQELGGKPALERLRETFSGLRPEDRKLAESALFLGLVINEYQASFDRGDFLIRNLVGIDPQRGAVAVADLVRVGATVQFHVRDAVSADEDLLALLQPHAAADRPPSGILLFDCNGRGTRMWDAPNHDVTCIDASLGGVPTGGFFCAGELGPIGGQNFVHGHTASVAMLSSLTRSSGP